MVSSENELTRRSPFEHRYQIEADQMGDALFLGAGLFAAYLAA